MISIYHGVRVDQNTVTIDISDADINALFGVANIAYNSDKAVKDEKIVAEKLMNALADKLV